MADFAFAVAEKVLEKVGSLALDEISLACAVRSDLDKLEKSVSGIKAVLLDAEQKLLDDSEENQAANNELRHWVRQLKGIFYDAEDVLDEFVVEDLERKVVSTMGFKRSFKRKVRRFFSSSSPIIFPFKMAQKLKSIRERLDQFAAEKDKFKLVERHGSTSIIHEDRETYSYVYKPDVIGREEDKEEVLKLLKQSDGENVSVIPIVGISGLGKTTLVKLVYNDEGLHSEFEKKIWVCVSEDFNLSTVIAKIIESAGEKCIGSSLEPLQKQMQEILMGKRYLLVLDDVWNQDPHEWMKLKSLLMSCSMGSKILVTTRSDEVADIMASRDEFKYRLSGLRHDHAVSLFFKHAFPQGDKDRYPRLMEIGEEIVKKCKGVPLAIITLATLLRSTREMREWESVKENEIWKLKQKKGDILPALRLSYEHLPPHLKRCFAYCSMFPKDYEFWDLQLVQFWIAHGLIVGSSSNNNENGDLEDVGLRYMKELASRCFFQELEERVSLIKCKMHDLVHDLALSVMKEEVSQVTSDSQPIAETVRHLYFPNPVTSSLPQNVSLVLNHFNHVRTLSFLTDSSIGLDSESFLEGCLLQFPYLRALDLQDSEIEELPRMIGTLKHLRYLNLLGNSRIKQLPNSICRLHSLQTLVLGNGIEELPRDIKYMIGLRCLRISTKQKNLDGIGCLKSLRILSIEGCENIEYLCDDMQGLKSLRKLGIWGCRSLICLPPSVKYLTALETLIVGDCENLSLTMEGKEGTDNDQDKSQLSLRQVWLEDLPNLVDLPEWLLRGSHNSLSSLFLGRCRSLKELPDWMKKLHSLQNLAIEDCDLLSERCERNTGEDWPKIAHIPHIEVDGETV